MNEEGQTLLGPGWTSVENFDDIDDDEYEDEEEEYVVLDLGTSMDARTLQTEATYQLVGLDTPQPFLKIGNHIFVGAVTPLIGDEVVFDVIRQEDDPQKPQHRPILTTHSRVSMREITLIPKITPISQPLPELHHGMFPQRNVATGVASAEAVSATATPAKSTPAAARKSTTRTPATGTSTPAASGTGTPATAERKTGRPKGRLTRVSLPISTMEDLMNIQLAGGLGDVRLEIAPDATPELLAQISSIRAKPTKPGDKLTKPQEDRLIRGLPATGPGSRGGRGSRGRRGTRGGRPSQAHNYVDSDSSPASAPAELEEEEGSGQPEAGPSGTRAETEAETPAADGNVDVEGDVQMAAASEGAHPESDDELREIDDEDLQALQK